MVVDDREMVRGEVRAGGEAESGPTDARFSLLVDPERMLVERVEGEEWLPGGLRQQTTLRIESIRMLTDDWVESAELVVEESEPVSSETTENPSGSTPTIGEDEQRNPDASSVETGRTHAGLSFITPAG